MPDDYQSDAAVGLCNWFLSEEARKLVSTAHARWLTRPVRRPGHGGELEPRPEEDAESYPLSWDVAAAFGDAFDEIEGLSTSLLANAAEPKLLVIDDVASLLRSYLRVPVERFDIAYGMMVGAILHELTTPRTSVPFPIGHLPSRYMSGDAVPTFEPPGVGDPDSDVIWTRNGIFLRLTGTSLATVDPVISMKPSPHFEEFLVYADVAGRASTAAITAIAARLRRAAPSVFASAFWVGEFKPAAVSRRTSLPHMNESTYEAEAGFIRGCFDALFVTGKRGGLEKRVHNAVALLVEADAQSEDFLRIALCIAAIEALLGQNTPELSSALADAVAVLLEPELEHRAAAADYMKRLYGVRSKVLHGEKLEGGRSDRDAARCIAACALKAVLVRRDFMVRAGLDVDTPEALLKELRQMRFASGPPVGVMVTPATKLWRDKR